MVFPVPYTEAAREMFEEKLVAVGKRLAKLPSTTKELQGVLEQAENVLVLLWQQPPMSTVEVLSPVMKSLLTDELLQHTDVNIQMVYASCMNEITRIALPDAAYDLADMKKIFQLFMVALRHLSSGIVDTINSPRALRILIIMSMLKTCLIVLDLECDQMVVDMFQLFFDIIRSDHPSDVCENMVTIMTMMIEEADNISVELVKTLLSSIKLDNKDASPMAWELGKTVIERCTTRLKPRVKEAIKTLNLDIKAYENIVSSMCKDEPNGEDAVAEEAVAAEAIVDWSGNEASRAEGISTEELKDSTPEMKDGNQNILENENSLKCSEQIVQPSNDDTRPDTHVAETSVAGVQPETRPQQNGDEVAEAQPQSGLQQESDKVAEAQAENGPQEESDNATAQRRRGRKPNSLLRPEEGYVHPWSIGGRRARKYSEGVSRRKKDLASLSEPGKADVQGSSSGKEAESVDEESTRTGDESRNTKSVARRKRKAALSNVRGRGSSTQKRTRRGSGSSVADVEKEGVARSCNDSEGEDELQRHHGRGSVRGGNVKKDKTAESSLSKPADDEQPESSVPEMEKKSRRLDVEYGEEMVNSRIMVWWPMDKAYYTGTIVSYDPELKKHKVIYDDDEEEVLDLKDETWELFKEDHPRPVQSSPLEEPSHPSTAKQPAWKQKTVTGRRRGWSKKQATSSSKRSRSEGRSAVESDNSSSSDSGNEASETYYS